MSETQSVILTVVAGIALIALAHRLANRKPRPKARLAELATTIPTLKVVTLGMQGSGKTLLLASMYRSMQTPGDRGFYFKAPHEQVIELGSWYHNVADPADVWPAGTRKSEMREFEFALLAHTPDAPEAVLRIGYLEYAGELLTEPQEPGATAQAKLLDAIDAADALIGIIDGLRVLQAYRADARGAAILQRSLDTMVSTMFTARSPIAFVITKWDLLDELHPDANIRLGIVRNLLMDVPGFRDLIREHGRRRVIRLIPVTAVGHSFAYLDNGTVHKKPGGRLRPVNVDVPLSVVVPDVLMQLEMSLDRATREAIIDAARRRTRPVEALTAAGTSILHATGQSLAIMGAGGIGLLASSWLGLYLDANRRPSPAAFAGDHRLSEADRAAQRAILARRKVIDDLQRQVVLLESRLPSSRFETGY